MKILQINCVYPNGATGKITSAIHHRLMAEGHTSVVLYSRGKPQEEPHTLRVSGVLAGKCNHLVSMFTGDVYGGCSLQTRRIIRYIKRYAPDLVHLQCINGYFVNIYRLLGFLKERRIPTVLTLHADFMFTANCGSALNCHQWRTGCGSCPQLYRATQSLFFDRTHASFLKMQKAMQGFGDRLTVVGVSNWISRRAADSSIMQGVKILTVPNGIDTAVFSSEHNDTPRKTASSDACYHVLWVTSLFTREKGWDHFLELAEKMKNAPCRFTVVGGNPPPCALDHITFVGRVDSPHQLAALYASADVVLCCSSQESFSLVSAEAQCCGTPVVAFDAGGVTETVQDGLGEVVPLGDISAMADAVMRQARRKADMSKELVDACRRRFDQARMTDAYLSLYEAALSGK